MAEPLTQFTVAGAGVELSGEYAGEGPPIVLLHGLTATRRYVVMGSSALPRAGFQVISYDARGHGRSNPAPARDAYNYDLLARDLEEVIVWHAPRKVVLAGSSMGAHTALRFALAHPERVAALVVVTPGYDPEASETAESVSGWDALARGLREGGVEGFVEAYDLQAVAEPWRATVETAIRQRMSAHAHPRAVADALEAVPRSRPFEDLSQLTALTCPAIVIGSRDEPDPGHPLALARRYAQALDAQLVVEDSGSPLAWQGGRVSRLIAQLARSTSGAGGTETADTHT
jgi:pimeloyl-ACP methyl ester carboxylesterase